MNLLKKIKTALFLSIVFLLLFTRSVRAQSTSSLGTILAIGDSITAGAPIGSSYLCPLNGLLASISHQFIGSSKTPCGVSEEAYGGNTSAQLLAKARSWNYSPNIAIIMLGANDIAQNVATATTKSNIQQIVQILKNKNPNVQVILSQVTPITGYSTSQLNSELRSLAQSVGAKIVSHENLRNSSYYTSCPSPFCNPPQAVDAAHFNNRGAELIAQNFYAVLAPQSGTQPAPPAPGPSQGGADAQCIGKALAPYMNTVINGAGNLNNIKLISPVFSASNPDSPEIVKAMSQSGANFAGLDGIGVNAYNGGGNTITGWSQAFMNAAGLSGSVLLTEIGNNSETKDINLLRNEANKIRSGNYIAGLLFNALNTNNDWASYSLNSSQLSTICGGNPTTCGKIGVNFATFYGETDQTKRVSAQSDYRMGFSLEIARNNPDQVANSINNLPGGITPVIRIGVGGDSGGFDNPTDYVNFLRVVNSKVGRQVFAIAGPNEPGYESWASPSCKLSSSADAGPSLKTSQIPIPQPYVPGGETRGNEFHSLRPYQASPHGMLAQYVEEDTLFCGNDIVVKQSYVVTPQGTCEQSGSSLTCHGYVLSGQAKIEVDLKDSDLPILGNTQLVPNRINEANLIDEATRVNEYLSWYLNGTAFSAYDNPLTDTVASIDRLINFSGPLNKLLPASSLDLKRAMTAQQVQYRHNQIYECLAGGNPVSCAEAAGSLVARLQPESDSGVGAEDPLNRSPYAPLSPMEDRAGELRVPSPQDLPDSSKPVQPIRDGIEVDVSTLVFTPDEGISETVTDTNDPSGGQITARNDLYFAHVEEASNLAELLQDTFRPDAGEGFSGDTGMDAPYFNSKGGGPRSCEIGDARSNPGDDLFGDLHQTTAPHPGSKYYKNISGTVNFTTKPFSVTFNLNPDPECEAQKAQICSTNPADPICASDCTNPSKKVNVYAALAVYTKAPKINEIAERLVGGDFSVLGKFFPQDILIEAQSGKNDKVASSKAIYKQPDGASSPNVEILAGDPSQGREGAQALIFFPHLGGVYNSFLQGLQCALRPQGMCGGTPLALAQSPNAQVVSGQCKAPQPGSAELSNIISVAQSQSQAASKVPSTLLEAIYWIEGFVYYVQNDGNYICEKNPFTAQGLMQVTDGAYNWGAPPGQRIETESCNPVQGKLNRCYSVDEMELAARVLLVKANKWNFQDFIPTGTVSLSNQAEVYRAASYYYGTASPDSLTQKFAEGNVPEGYWRDGSSLNMGYGDLVYYYMYCKDNLASSCKYPSRAGLL